MSARTSRQLADIILQGLDARDSGPCLSYEGLSYSGPSLSRQVRRLAARLQRAGLAPGMRIAVALENRAALLLAMLALWLNDAIYAPLDPTQPHPRQQRLLLKSRIDRLVITANALNDWHDSPCPLLVWPEDALSTTPVTSTEDQSPTLGIPSDTETLESTDPANRNVSGAYLMHSSGTAGEPKGIIVSAASLWCLLAAIRQRLPLPSPLHVLGHNHPCFDISLLEWLLPLLHRGRLILLSATEARDPDAVSSMISQSAITLLQATPTRWQQWLDRGGLPPVALCLSGGEALPRALASRLLAWTPQVWNLYGPTETCIWATAHPVTAQDCRSDAPTTVSIGQPLPGYSLAIGDGAELFIAGSGLALGYSDQPLPLRDMNGQPCYASGDRARQDKEGNWHWLGRRDLQIKHLGQRLHPGEIEALLLGHPCLDAAVIMQARDAQGFSQLVALVVHSRDVPNKDRKRLNRFLRRHLPDSLLPQRYLFLPDFPVLANGKVDRQALKQILDGALQAPQPAMAVEESTLKPEQPESLKALVRQCFSQLLGVTQFSDWDSFFDLGGHSMLVASLQLMLEQVLDCRLSLPALLARPPTVHSVLACLEDALPAASSEDSGCSG